MRELRTRLVGLAATATILLLVAGTPTVLIAIGVTPGGSDLSRLGTLLTSPDDGTLALVLIGVVAWLAWAVMMVSLTVETTARLRGMASPRLPGLGAPQQLAGRLVAIAALAFVVAPTIAPAFAPPPVSAATPPQTKTSSPVEVASVTPAAPTPAVSETPNSTPADEAPTVAYTVRRGDSLWKIAKEQLGDAKRYTQIHALNRDVLGERPDFVPEGIVLRLPHGHAPEDASTGTHTVIVKPGDTLSQIALDQLGDSGRYTEIADASRGTVQPSGAHLHDPNLIRPGWKLTIPDQTAPEPVESDAPPLQPEASAHIPPPAEEPTVQVDVDDSADEDHINAAWLLPGLAGTGTVLAGALLIAIRRHGRTQLRYRRPGQIIAPPPPELRAVEKTAHTVGAAMAPQLEKFDTLLRWLAASVTDPPAVLSVEITPSAVNLHLAHDAELPAPWEGDGTTWAIALDTDVPDQTNQIPPYPLLVTVGRDQTEHLWLLNLEHLGVVTITGDLDKAEAFGRYVAAELVLNPWSVLVCVDTVGLGEELAPLDSLRLHHHGANDLGFLDQLAHNLDPEVGLPHLEPDLFHAVITATEVDGPAPVRKVVKLITSYPGRPGAAVVTIGGTPDPGNTVVEVTTDGRLIADSLGLDVIAVGLTTGEAAACAAIADITRDAQPAPMPVDDASTDGWRGLTDCAGALRDDLARARPQSPASPGGEESLLPLAATQYADAAATTIEDIGTLAPTSPAAIRSRVEDADSVLDEDLALWFGPNCPLPKLMLLGPVSARAHGDTSAVVKRKPFYIELLSYLALHPAGTTSAEVTDAMSITTNRSYVDVKMLRSWLGTNPRTGTDHLPSAKRSRASTERGTPVYQLDDVLVDVDLFRRLRARAQARGVDGIADLETALRLVTGPPFSQLRPVGWSWLFEGERIDHVMTCAVADVAHILTTHALAAGDLSLARFSAETACHAAPYDEISQLDLVQVAAVTGHADLAERHLIDGIFNRSDDDLGPIDLPPRTAQVVAQRGWDRRKPRQ